MKVKLVISSDIQEEVVTIEVRDKRVLVDEIINLCNADSEDSRVKAKKIIGYDNESFCVLDTASVHCFVIDNGKTYALLDGNKRYLVKMRIYELEDYLSTFDNEFVKISQCTLINVSNVAKFEALFNGRIVCLLKCGVREYVSRRFMSNLKAKLGI